MKRNIQLGGLFLGLFLGQNGFAQEENWHEHLRELKEKSDKFNLYLNIQSSFEAQDNSDEQTEIGFKARQLRLEFRGDLTEKIFYRLRHRLNKSNAPSSLDNLADATDMAYVGIRLNDKWAIKVGKIPQNWGGFEYDFNPIFIYQYSEFINHHDSFLVGANITHIPNEQHEFNLSITNSRTEKFEKIYGENTGIEPSRAALAYLLNWNGNLLNNTIQTRWAVGYQQDAKKYGSITMALGTMFHLPQFQFSLDYYRSDESLDRMNYAQVIDTTEPLKNITYQSWVSQIHYQPSEKWNIFTKGMYETYSLHHLPQGATDTQRKSIGYQTGVEYTPFKNQNLKIFAVFLGKKFIHRFKELDYHTHRISLGLSYHLKAF